MMLTSFIPNKVNLELPSIYFSNMIIESPEGRKAVVKPINSFPVSNSESFDTQFFEWSCHVLDVANELGELEEFFCWGWSPTLFFKALLTKGYKISWGASS